MRVLACCLLLTACAEKKLGPPLEGDPASAQSGERLRARFLGTEEASALIHFYDAGLDFDCAFTRTKDGIRCLPLRWGELHYLRPNCTGPAVILAPEPGLITASEAVYRATELAEPAEHFVRWEGQCAPITAGDAPFRRVEEVLDFSDFVEGQQVEVDAEVRLTRLGVAGEDGSWQPGGWFDRELEMECYGKYSGVAAAYCGSKWIYISDLRAPDCGAFALATDAPPGSVVWHSEPAEEACAPNGEPTLRPVLDEIDLEDVGSLGADGTCNHVPILGVERAYVLGDPLDPDAILGSLQLEPGGEGPVQLLEHQASDGRRNPRSSIIDLKEGGGFWYLGHFVLADQRSCGPAEIDGRILCLPASATLSPRNNRFADSLCSEHVVSASREGLLLVGAYEPYHQAPWGRFVEVRELGEAVPSESVFTLTNEECKPLGDVCATFHRVGELTDVSGYPELFLRTE